MPRILMAEMQKALKSLPEDLREKVLKVHREKTERYGSAAYRKKNPKNGVSARDEHLMYKMRVAGIRWQTIETAMKLHDNKGWDAVCCVRRYEKRRKLTRRLA